MTPTTPRHRNNGRPPSRRCRAGCSCRSPVLLEFEWALRGFYKLPQADTVRVLRALAGIEHVTLEDRGAALSAIDACEAGLDFADALHLARSGRCAAFVSFDRRLAERGKVPGLTPAVETLV